MTKSEIMRVANLIVLELMDCGDEEFVDQVIAAIADGASFSDDEIAEEQALEAEDV